MTTNYKVPASKDDKSTTVQVSDTTMLNENQMMGTMKNEE